MSRESLTALEKRDEFVDRHIGPNEAETQSMLQVLGLKSLDELVERTVPAPIRTATPLDIAGSRPEREVLDEIGAMAAENEVFRSFIGLGYYDTFTPPVILRNVLENPGWYTAYTPYQAEISQGRLEALLNFQTMVIDLTGLEVANSSLLDEATAAAEAITLCYNHAQTKGQRFFVSKYCHPQTIAVVQTRAEAFGIDIEVGDETDASFDDSYFGVLLQYPRTEGSVVDPTPTIERAHAAQLRVVVASDLLALTQLESPGKMGADVVIGNSQRFGVPFGFGGPHAAFFATREEFKRKMPGRIVGVSVDARGKAGLRLALQTREQHIRREKATSNICTAQVLLAVMASMYAVYHGPKGLRTISSRVHRLATILANGLQTLGLPPRHDAYFDTLAIPVSSAAEVIARAEAAEMNLRPIDDFTVGISLDERTRAEDVESLWTVLSGNENHGLSVSDLDSKVEDAIPANLRRQTPYLEHSVFNSYHSETEMLRYLHRLQERDLSLTRSMIPLGSCTMKLNATAEMIPVTWPKFASIHPFAPLSQAKGYVALIDQLEDWLAKITGFSAVSMQPNAGSQGEYAGLLVIRKYHEQRGDAHRKICLIPSSAHGTNPASAVMAGFKVVVVRCDDQGNVDLEDLENKAREHSDNLGALMVTYPSTHGVFEEGIKRICGVIHEHGGQVYMDGANMNALIGLCRPPELGADVLHLNLHKTFCIPHGGGGPGMGPIGVQSHLAPFLPRHPLVPEAGPETGTGAVSAAPWGSPGILPISWAYIALMGGTGLKKATEVAILNANYIARRLEDHYPVLYKGTQGMVAHECIIDCRPLKKSAGVGVDDIAKRLIDYGFHAPTMSWPVAGTLMIEPTESESKAELDRFCDALIQIREEVRKIESGIYDPKDNPLMNAPHPVDAIATDEWSHPYSRDEAAYPLAWVRESKFWPPVARVDNAHGDRNFVCACPPLEVYS